MKQMINLDRNENLYGPAPKCLDVLHSLTGEGLSRYSRDYQRGVKSRLTERLSQDLNIPESQILLSDGSEDMLKQVVHCYLGAGDTMLCPAESWWYYQVVAGEVGGVTTFYPLKEEKNRYSYDVDAMIKAGQRNPPRPILIASPNNPTGNSIDDQDLEQLSSTFPTSIIVLDEAY
jgi:histidinol-phosphate aminotransferase